MNFLVKYYHLIIIVVILFSCVIGILFRKKRHHFKIQQSKKILLRIRSFEGDNLTERKLSYLRKINPFTFEELILSALEESGAKIKRNKRYTGDGGVDGKFKIDGNWYLIQAKRYSNYISLKDMEKFEILCKKQKIRGVFIHTGKVGKDTLSRYNNKHIKIIGPYEFIDFIDGKPLIVSNH